MRSICELALFAGAGGGILGGHLLGWRTVCAVEIDPYCRHVLVARQNDGTFPPFPIWDDVRTFDGRPWRGLVDVVSGGFPCQDISCANQNAAGIDGERSGLWVEMARVIGEVHPRFAFVENSPILVRRGLDRVLADLSDLGMDAVWGVVGADDAGLPHRRKRIWIVGYRPDADRDGLQGGWAPSYRENRNSEFTRLVRDFAQSGLSARPSGRMVDGIPHRTQRLRAIGNAQVPRVAALAWDILTGIAEALKSVALTP